MLSNRQRIVRRARRRSHERGAVAVVVALATVLVIFPAAALSVDLGNGFARKREVQSQADFAAMAGAKELPGAGTAPVASDLAIQQAAKYLADNQPRDGGTRFTPTQLATMLTDTSTTNGQAYYGRLNGSGGLVASRTELTIVVPPRLVQYGFAKVIGVNNVRIRASATAKVYSPITGVSPFYASSACSYGMQTLKSNSGGLSIPVTVPRLYKDNESNTAVLSGTLNPLELALGATGQILTVPGTGLTGVTAVGFFRSDRSSPRSVPVVAGDIAADGKSLRVVVPSDVTAIQEAWYVRVEKGGVWSTRSEALSLLVGDAVLECDPESTNGNFGSLELPGRTGNTGDQIALNTSLGLVSPLTLAKYPDPVPAGECPQSDSRTVLSTTNPTLVLKAGTNCAMTQPGLQSGAATDGLVLGVGTTAPGRLRKDTSSACTAVGRPTRGPSGITGTSGAPVTINDDLLTCFFTDTGTTIAQIANESYAGPPVLSADIYRSPRFSWVPIFTTDPSGSKIMPIMDLRPMFITDQPLAATKGNNLTGDLTINGLVTHSNRIHAIKAIMFNPKALPDPDGGPVADYMGTGPKVVRLTN